MGNYYVPITRKDISGLAANINELRQELRYYFMQLTEAVQQVADDLAENTTNTQTLIDDFEQELNALKQNADLTEAQRAAVDTLTQIHSGLAANNAATAKAIADMPAAVQAAAPTGGASATGTDGSQAGNTATGSAATVGADTGAGNVGTGPNPVPVTQQPATPLPGAPVPEGVDVTGTSDGSHPSLTELNAVQDVAQRGGQ